MTKRETQELEIIPRNASCLSVVRDFSLLYHLKEETSLKKHPSRNESSLFQRLGL